MQKLLEVMRQLRAPEGCPWDREQTHESLRPYLLEEAAEAVDAVTQGPEALCAELGDVLLQVAFHAVIAEEEGTFAYPDIEKAIVDKLIRRHPHVFGGVQVSGSAEVVSNWQAIKAAESGGKPRKPSAKVPSALGALAREAQTQKLAGQPVQTRSDVLAQLARLPDSPQAVAQALALVVAWAREQGVDPELALRDHTGQTLQALDRNATE